MTTSGKPPAGVQPYHYCAALDCRRHVRWNWLMCARHWSLVPPPIQARVYATWNNGAPSTAHRQAVTDAIASLVRQAELPL